MKKFTVLYHASNSALEQMRKSTPAQKKAGMDAWLAWAKEAGSAIVDLGTPLGNGKSITRNTVSLSKKEVCGYSILQAESTEDIIKLLKKHPHFMTPGPCSIEVHEQLSIDEI
jgi:hypothetical protein